MPGGGTSTHTMTDYEVHQPNFHETGTEHWDEPDRADFGERDLDVIDDHFLLSASGFPPEVFGDLELPVVTPDGELNLHGLQNAHTGPDSVETLDLDEETERTVKDLIESLIHEHFEGEREEVMGELQQVRFEAFEDYRENMQEYHLHHEDVVREAQAEEIANPDLHRDEDPHSQQN